MLSTMNADSVREILRRGIEQAGSLRKWAASAGVSPAYVSDVLHSRREPAGAICAALGIERRVLTTVSYRRASD